LDKFGRNYELEVETPTGGLLTIRPPFSLQFDITRNALTSANICQLRIYNLNELNRSRIRFNISDYGTFRGVKLKAGYGKNLAEVFSGNISQAWSQREKTDFITTIECYDGGFAFVNGITSKQFGKGTSQKDIIKDLGSSMPGVSLGAVGDFEGVTKRSNSYDGPTMEILGGLTGGAAFIDNGKFHALLANEYIESDKTVVINADTGLLATPVLEQTIVRFSMIFEPSLAVGSRIKLESQTEKNFNGFYKTVAVKHRGIISDAVAGNLETTGEFFYSKILTGVRED